MLSQTAKYALQAVVFLAIHSEGPATTQDIAKATGIASGYLSKVMQLLVRGGIVRSQRGLNGGFSLLKPAADLSIFEVVKVVDPASDKAHCPLDLQDGCAHSCPLFKKLRSIELMVEKAYKETFIQELVSVGMKNHCFECSLG